jgi:hypothetical protein
MYALHTLARNTRIMWSQSLYQWRAWPPKICFLRPCSPSPSSHFQSKYTHTCMCIYMYMYMYMYMCSSLNLQ